MSTTLLIMFFRRLSGSGGGGPTPTGDPLDASFRSDGRMGSKVTHRKPGSTAGGRFHFEEQESQADN
jgi:hypothetical protein